MRLRHAAVHARRVACSVPVFFSAGCDGSEGVVVGASLLAGMLGAALVVRVLVPRQRDEAPATLSKSRDAQRPSPVTRAAEPIRAAVETAGTELFVSQCPQHRDAPGTWTCRFCKRDHCDKCRTSIGGIAVCPSRACRDVAERQRNAAGERRGATR